MRWRTADGVDLKPLGCGIEGDELDHRCECGQLLSKPVS